MEPRLQPRARALPQLSVPVARPPAMPCGGAGRGAGTSAPQLLSVRNGEDGRDVMPQTRSASINLFRNRVTSALSAPVKSVDIAAPSMSDFSRQFVAHTLSNTWKISRENACAEWHCCGTNRDHCLPPKKPYGPINAKGFNLARRSCQRGLTASLPLCRDAYLTDHSDTAVYNQKPLAELARLFRREIRSYAVYACAAKQSDRLLPILRDAEPPNLSADLKTEAADWALTASTGWQRR